MVLMEKRDTHPEKHAVQFANFPRSSEWNSTKMKRFTTTYTRVECSVFAPVAMDTQETPQNSGVT